LAKDPVYLIELGLVMMMSLLVCFKQALLSVYPS